MARWEKRKPAALALALLLCLNMAGCGQKTDPAPEETPLRQPVAQEEPLAVGCRTLSGMFSPFFWETPGDLQVVSLTQLSPLTLDRGGSVISSAIEGESSAYHGKTYTYTGPCDVQTTYDEDAGAAVYTLRLRDDLRFSNGTAVTVDDLLFSIYAYLDPDYDGPAAIKGCDIVGLRAYQTQTADSVYDRYHRLAEQILAAGEGHRYTGEEAWSQEMQQHFWEGLREAWRGDVQRIVSYCWTQYAAEVQKKLGVSQEEAEAQPRLKTALAMVLWGYAQLQDGVLQTMDEPVRQWDLKTEFPDTEGFFDLLYAAYEGDASAFFAQECQGVSGGKDPAEAAGLRFLQRFGPRDTESGGGFSSISGIEKTEDDTVTIRVRGFDPQTVYSLCDFFIAPLAYYGDQALWKPEQGQYGHLFADLSGLREKNARPLGAGVYTFDRYENGVVTLRANAYSWTGTARCGVVQMKETDPAQMAAQIAAGSLDVAALAATKTRLSEITLSNGGVLSGDVMETVLSPGNTYGYVGINARTVNVGGQPEAAASKALRRALCTVLALCRDAACADYYGGGAEVAQLPFGEPFSPVENAYSLGPDGQPLYEGGQAFLDRRKAALQAAVQELRSAGYVWDEATRRFTAAPKGAKLSYTALIPAEGMKNHPAYAMLKEAQEALVTIGITLKISDESNAEAMWEQVDAGTQEIWCGTRACTAEPDLWKAYAGESDENDFGIHSAELDELLLRIRATVSQTQRRQLEQTCLTMVMEQAVEIPYYQRKTCTLFSTQRIRLDTVATDLTAYWDWTREIALLEKK